MYILLRVLQIIHNWTYSFNTRLKNITIHIYHALKNLSPFLSSSFNIQGLKVTYDFVDTHFITQTYIEAIGKMRPFFTSNSEAAKKYRDDLFLIGPFYHRIFPYNKFIMLDADLKFRIDIAELYDMFEDFSNNQVMGVGVDLAPHYRIAFREYRKTNPNTMVGEPGRFQVKRNI